MKRKSWNLLTSATTLASYRRPSLPTTVNLSRLRATTNSYKLPLHRFGNRGESNRHRVRRTASVALLSIFLCSAMLTYMLSLFSTKLRTVESQLPHSDQLWETSMSAHPRDQRFHSGRRLASTHPSHARSQLRKTYSSPIVEKFYRSFVSIKLILSLLNNRKRSANALTTFVGSQLAYVSPMTTPPRPSEGEEGFATVISVYHVRNGKPGQPPTKSLPGVRSMQTNQKTQPARDKTASSSIPPGNGLHYPNPRQPPANVIKTDGLNAGSGGKITGFRSASPTKRQQTKPWRKIGQRKSEPEKRPEPMNHWSETEAGKLKAKQVDNAKAKESTSSIQDMIEIWMLRSTNCFCRIYNVGRLPEGRLVLPKWMEKHSIALLHQCGVRDPIFAITSKGKDKKFVFDKNRLNMTGSTKIIDNANIDLFSSNAPRHHMPHFVSDMILPLRATELLKGSGNGIAKLSYVRTSSSSNSPEPIKKAFPDLKPALFLRGETWEETSSAWVRRLANFFSNPAVGFTLLSEEDRRRPNQPVPHNKNNVVWRFRSVLTSNSNQYEGEGLFDRNGNNFVFSRNGLSGAPAWTIRGISREPCRVVVTALTRLGPRALLHLDVLKKEAIKLFASGGLLLDFKVVKFENAGFDTQVQTMQETNVLIATHGAGNTNVIFMRRGATVIEVFPFAYRAGPFDGFARTFGLEYKAAMSAPQTKIFKECMKLYENNDSIRAMVFRWWDKAVAEEAVSPWVHRLELEKEFGDPGKSEGMMTRRCVRAQQLAFDTKAVAAMAFESAKRQCNDLRFRSKSS